MGFSKKRFAVGSVRMLFQTSGSFCLVVSMALDKMEGSRSPPKPIASRSITVAWIVNIYVCEGERKRERERERGGEEECVCVYA